MLYISSLGRITTISRLQKKMKVLIIEKIEFLELVRVLIYWSKFMIG